MGVPMSDVAAMKKLLERGVVLEARPLPLDEPVELAPLVDRWGKDGESFREQPR